MRLHTLALCLLIAGASCTKVAFNAETGGQCNDGIDNDLNALTDCADPSCATESACLCGNGVTDPGEECDDGNTNDGDSCEVKCTLPVCGNNILDQGEQCDDGNTAPNDSCEPDCTLPSCGNQIVDQGEQCDDGNNVQGDGCESDCTSSRCGNGILDIGEACDNGALNGQANNPCTSNCRLATCGDGVVQTGEQCDNGALNGTAGNSCNVFCASVACGNGFVDDGEQCDDGNVNNNDGCSSACQFEACGNGAVDPGEQCDDGNLTNGDGCESTCKLPFCGNGIIDQNEECDDGNVTDGDTCEGDCSLPACGNNILDLNEQCDDGNLTSGDGCEPSCTLPFCGSGVVDPGEQCDDGNFNDFDGCFTSCLLNDAPSFNAIPNQSTNEDVPKTVSITGIIAGPADESAQVVTVTAVSSDPSIVPNPTVSAVSSGSATLSYAPVANASGTVTITVTAQDNGGSGSGAIDSAQRTFTIDVIAVADAPNLVANDVSGQLSATPAPIPLAINSSLNDNDGSESLSVVIKGFPGGSTFSAGTVSGSASGFLPITNFAVAGGPFGEALGDFNEDGIQDLAVTSQTANTISVLLGNGAGGFGAPIIISIPTGSEAFNVAVGDFNEDTHLDLVSTNRLSTVNVFLGDGTGHFGTPTAFSTGAGSNSNGVITGDFNEDTHLDLAVTNVTGSAVNILLGNGAGSFGTASNLPSGGKQPFTMVVGDFNEDTHQDIAIANADTFDSGSPLSILFGDGFGNFAKVDLLGFGPSFATVVIGDFNGDGHQDLAAADDSNNANVLLGTGTGSFGALATFPLGANDTPFGLAVGDLNGDGKEDLVSANSFVNSASVLFGDGTGSFGAPDILAVAGLPLAVVVADLNSDGNQDIITANQSGNKVSVFLGDTIQLTLTQAQLAGLTVTPPQGFVGTASLSATATATEASNNDQASTVDNFTVSVNAPEGFQNPSFETGDFTGWTLSEVAQLGLTHNVNPGTPPLDQMPPVLEFGIWGIAADGSVLKTAISGGAPVFDFFDQTTDLWQGCDRFGPINQTINVAATAGNFAAVQLTTLPEKHRMFQDVIIPANATTLSWDMLYHNFADLPNPQNPFSPNSQFIALNIRNPNTDAILATPFITTTGVDASFLFGMTPFSVNISAFAGQRVRIDIEMQVTQFCMDAVFDNFQIQ